MTNEQAIHLLHRLQDEQFDGIHGDERREALEMAVRALEPNLGNNGSICTKTGVNDEDRTTGDTIYRQDAIDAINRISRTSNWKAATTMVIAELSSAQPEYSELKREFILMASYIDSLLECSDLQRETLNGFISRMGKLMPWNGGN